MIFKWEPFCIKNDIVQKDEEHFYDPDNLNSFAEDIFPDNSYVYINEQYDFFDNKFKEYTDEIWQLIKKRNKVLFYIFIDNINLIDLPEDWGAGYGNVVFVFRTNSIDLNSKIEKFDNIKSLNKILYINSLECECQLSINVNSIQLIVAEGKDKLCDFKWAKDLKEYCNKNQISFIFRSIGDIFKFNDKIYKVSKEKQQQQAKLANLDLIFKKRCIKVKYKENCNRCNRIYICRRNCKL